MESIRRVRSLMDIEIIATFEHFLAELTAKVHIQVFPFNMFVHISGLVAGVVADGTAPDLLSSNIKSLYHLGLYYPVKLC